MAATHGVGVYGNAVGVTTPLDMKMAQLGLVVKTAANTIRSGLFWDGNATVVSGKANMSYDVRAITAVTSRGATAGAVLLTNDAVYNVTTTAAPGSNSRYDVVYLWQREYSIDGTDSNPVIGVVQGTAAASPSVPSLAAYPGALSLAQILVPAGVTATNSGTTITQTAPFTAVDGGVVTARTTTERDAYTPAAADTKAKCWVIADNVTYVWNGTAWVNPKAFVSLGMSAAQNSASGGTPAAVTWDNEIADDLAFHDNSTNKDRITIPTGYAGRYLVHASITLNTSVSGHYAIGDMTVAASGTPTTQVAIPGTAKTVPVVAGVNAPTFEATAIVTLSVGDIVRVRVADTSATAIVVASAGIQMEKLS